MSGGGVAVGKPDRLWDADRFLGPTQKAPRTARGLLDRVTDVVLVERMGVEPTTSAVRLLRSPN